VFGADLRCGEQAEERRAGCCLFHGGAAIGFFALDDADYGDNRHASLAGGFDGVDGGCAGGADVIDDDDARALLAKAFDAAAGAMAFFGLADQKAVQQRRGGIGLRAPSAGRGHVGDDGVGTHGESADGLGIDPVLFQQFKDGVAGKASALGVERGGAAVDVVIACAARGELEEPEPETGSGQMREQLLGMGRAGHRF